MIQMGGGGGGSGGGNDIYKKRWEDIIKEWSVVNFASTTSAAEDRTTWKGLVVKSSVVPR